MTRYITDKKLERTGDNEKDKEETKEIEPQDHDAYTSSDGIIELT